MSATPRGMRLHIGLFGRRNAGKSSLANALVGQPVALVSEVPGTTADPVEKPVELRPLGPVLLIDTAGLDDEGELGNRRLSASKAVFGRVDLALVVGTAPGWGAFEDDLVREFAERKIPVVAVLNQEDRYPGAAEPAGLAERVAAVARTTASAGSAGVETLRAALVAAAPAEWIEDPPLLRDLVAPGGQVLLVVPVDSGAPRGRLILPQVRALRDALDGGLSAVVCRDAELAETLARFPGTPALTVTDSQAFGKVAAALPADAALTGFSVLFARANGDLAAMARGAETIPGLKPGDRVLIAESCAHHAGPVDIGRVQIPRCLDKAAGGALVYEHVRGREFPERPNGYALMVHCGACMTNRREILERLRRCAAAGVPATNYGLVLAWSQGVFNRALEPFRAAGLLGRE